MTPVAVSPNRLAWLIHPVEPEEFFASYWETRPLLIERSQPAYYGALPGLGEVDGLITTTAFGAHAQDGRLVRTEDDYQLSQRPFRLTGDGRPDIHDIYRWYTQGYTVVLNRIEARSPAVGALCLGLEADLHHRVGANLYLTPRSAQGSRAHVDSHDVVIAQLHGIKKWRVSTEPSRQLSTAISPGIPIEILDANEYHLRPGDALYIPRGCAHEAMTDTSSSLHLTVGISVITWADLLSEALRLIAAGNHELRRPLPVGHLQNSFDESEIATLLQSLAAVPAESVLESARLSLGARLLKLQAASAGHFRSLDSLSKLSLDSVVGRGFEGPCRIRTVGEHVFADYPGNFLSVPLSLAPALEHAVSRKTFTVESIPCELSNSVKVDFVKRLVREGFLAVVSNGEEANSD